MDKLAIVVPCYNEEEAFSYCADELKRVIEDLVAKKKISEESFVLFVDDGSKDKTFEIMEQYHSKNPSLYKSVKLGGNVGHQYALTAGLMTAMQISDVTVSIDADLQDDTAVIEEMIDKYHDGCGIVYGVRKKRDTDTFFKRFTAQGFYKLMNAMGVKTVYNHADFRLMSKEALQEFSQYGENNLFLRGIVPLLGFKSDCVYYDRKERVAGESKYPLKKMIALAFDGISSSSSKPLTLITGLGVTIIVLCLIAAVYSLISFFCGHVVPGWTSLFLSVWFLGGVQLVSIGLIGQYVGKIFVEVKKRPRYRIEKSLID